MRCGLLSIGVVLLMLAAGCGDDERAPDPADAVRAAARAYVDALRGERWAVACDRMTPAGREAVAEGGGSCAARPRHPRPSGDVAATVTRRVPVEDGVRLELTLPNGRVHAYAPLPGPQPGDTVRLTLAAGITYPQAEIKGAV